MTTVKTRHPVERQKLQAGRAITSANGLPLDSVLEITATHQLIRDTQVDLVSYVNPTVTVPASFDLEAVKLAQSRYTGRLALRDVNGKFYFIDRLSMSDVTKSFNIYTDPELTQSPASIPLTKGWIICEIQLVNRLAVSANAQIDEVNISGFDVQFQLSGDEDSIKIVDSDGDELDINPDGTIDVNVNVDADDGDDIAISRHESPFRYTASQSRTQAQINVATYTQVFAYSAVQPELRIKHVKVHADTLGSFRVLINGTPIDYFRTSFTERNAHFTFSEEEDLPLGSVISVEFKPDRNRLANYDFFTRLEGYYNT